MKLPVSAIKKIAVFRVLQLGDLLCSVPAFRALRNAYPEAHITLLGLPWAKWFTERFNQYFNDFLHFPGYPALPEQPFNPRATVEFLQQIQTQRYDLVLQMQGNGSIVNPLMELFGTRYVAGFYKADDYAPNKEYFMEYPNYGSEVERHLKLMEFLGIDSQGTDLEFPLTAQDQADFDKLNLPVIKGRYVCIHAGSRGVSRRWPPEYFAALGDYIADQGFEVVLTGTKDELEIVEQVIAHMKHKPLNSAGITTLGAVGVLIKNAYGLISNCTGVSHVASAMKTRSVVISLDGEPERWGPLNKSLHHTLNWHQTPDFNFVKAEVERMLCNYE
jgi:ADP-heptose:LPS heptosyltransferase